MTAIQLRNGECFYVEEDYERVTGVWQDQRTGKYEFRRCDGEGTFRGRVLIDVEQISNVFEEPAVDPEEERKAIEEFLGPEWCNYNGPKEIREDRTGFQRNQ